MKVITFLRYFPKGHPRAGESTFFPEKIISSLGLAGEYISTQKFTWMNDFSLAGETPKSHTIRTGNRWKAGEHFSARVWSGKPYASKQIEFAQIEIKKIFDFEIKPSLWFDECSYLINTKSVTAGRFIDLAKNDGLNVVDLMHWFSNGKEADSNRKGFKGQIICWNENINYE